jgi:hypothetical protein
MAKYELLIFWKDHCPASTAARAVVAAVGAELRIPVQELFARDAHVGPWITRYEICEVPTVALRQGRTLVWSTGTPLTKAALTRRLKDLKPTR